MEAVGIITDSHSGISQQKAEEMGIYVLPMPFYIDGECYFEGISLTREQLFEKMRAKVKVSTSQPSLASVREIWDRGLARWKEILYIPLSSGLSGSCASAAAMAREEPYAGRVFVVDNGRISTPLHRSILDAQELIAEGKSAREIRDILEANKHRAIIYLAVDTLDYLHSGGRISRSTAVIGSILNIKPVLKLDVGLLEPYKNCRGSVKARHTMLEALRHDLETTFREPMERGEIYLMAASGAGEAETEKWHQEIREAFGGMELMSDPLSFGICCHTGPGALGVGVSCKPR